MPRFVQIYLLNKLCVFFFIIFINNVFARWQSIRESVQKKQFAFVLTTLTVKTLYAGNTRNREGRQKAKAELSEARKG